jgi:hypothetical protein
MTTRSAAGRVTLVLGLLLPATFATTAAHADRAAANKCAAGLPKDAKAIYDTTLPQIKPGSDLRALVTSNTRSLAMGGKIGVGGARDSADAAGVCLKLAGS